MSSALLASRRACRAENPKVVATALKSEPASAISASTIAVFISSPVGTVQGERPRLAAGGRHRRPPGRYPPERSAVPILDLGPAAREVSRLLDGVDDKQLPEPTPCPGYPVAALLDHL